ncbi:MAG TPA: hypothetical protein VHY09_09635 [Candidatus Methylacidiphilales bacterium]|nr:hypothetical protein [Candidatus Methylacidiphilales bacterium]
MELLERVVVPVESPDPKSIVNTCDFLISQAMRRGRALLSAEAAPERKEVPWLIFDRSYFERKCDGSLIYVSNTPGGLPFRPLLARFGASYMEEGCLYGGFTRGTLVQNGVTFGYNLFMSNDGRSDFWVRLYVWQNTEPGKEVHKEESSR